MNAIAFNTTEGPIYMSPTRPEHCALWVWRTMLFPTNNSGLKLDISTREGFIVQKVQTSRNVVDCKNIEDEDSSDESIGWEYWDLSTVPLPCLDLIAQPFLKQRKTKIEVTLSAGYLRRITGVTFTLTPGNPNGASGTLSGRPDGFTFTLERAFTFDVNCCDADSPFSWSLDAQNTFGDYSERWQQEGKGIPDTKPSRKKEVGGRQVE